MKFYLIVYSFLFYSVSYAELYDSSNHPSNFRKLLGIREITQFDLLPKEGGLSDKRMGGRKLIGHLIKGELLIVGVIPIHNLLSTDFIQKKN